MSSSSDIVATESFDIPKSMDSLDGLISFQEQVIIAAVDAAEAVLRFSYHIHMILEYDLWRHQKTDDGEQIFNSQSEYLEHVHDLCVKNGARITGISTMKAYHTAMRLARNLGYEMDNVREKGITIFNDVANMIVLDRSTGEPKKLKAGDVPDGYNISGYVREVIDEFGPDSSHEMQSGRMDILKNIESKLANKKPRVEFDIPNVNRPDQVTWHVEMYDKDGAMIDIPGNHSLINDNVPDFVKEAWFNKVGCGWRLKG